MPIYLCLPGHSSKEPWRHGMKIFDRPRDLNESGDGHKGDGHKSTTSDHATSSNNNENKRFTMRSVSDSSEAHSLGGGSGGISKSTAPATDTVGSIRRARHAEVLLADSILYSHNRHWLRLRWPGHHGGLGGFVALEKCDVDELKKAGVTEAYPSSESMKLLEEYDDGLGVGEEEGECGLEVREFILLPLI